MVGHKPVTGNSGRGEVTKIEV